MAYRGCSVALVSHHTFIAQRKSHTKLLHFIHGIRRLSLSLSLPFPPSVLFPTLFLHSSTRACSLHRSTTHAATSLRYSLSLNATPTPSRSSSYRSPSPFSPSRSRLHTCCSLSGAQPCRSIISSCPGSPPDAYSLPRDRCLV